MSWGARELPPEQREESRKEQWDAVSYLEAFQQGQQEAQQARMERARLLGVPVDQLMEDVLPDMPDEHAERLEREMNKRGDTGGCRVVPAGAGIFTAVMTSKLEVTSAALAGTFGTCGAGLLGCMVGVGVATIVPPKRQDCANLACMLTSVSACTVAISTAANVPIAIGAGLAGGVVSDAGACATVAVGNCLEQRTDAAIAGHIERELARRPSPGATCNGPAGWTP